MSQRTRSRTTGAAAHKKRPSATRQTSASSSATPSPLHGDAADPSITPETLARTLRAVADELERDPALARRLAAAITPDQTLTTPPTAPTRAPADRPDVPADAEQPRKAKPRTPRAFTPSIITGVSPDLGPGIPDPFALARRLGPDGLRAALGDLRRGTLRAMIREHGIAPAAQVARIADDAKLRELILAAVASDA